jgi:hypothetical protein
MRRATPFLWLLHACNAPAPGERVDPPVDTGADTSAPDDTAVARCEDVVVESADLQVSTYDFRADTLARIPGSLDTRVVRSDEELAAWLTAEIGYVATDWSIDWDAAVSLIGQVDAIPVGAYTRVASELEWWRTGDAP